VYKLLYFLVVSLSLTLISPDLSRSQNTAINSLNSEEKGPIEINSDRMRSEDGGKKIVFSGKVTGLWGELKIDSDILEIYNDDKGNQTDEIVAIGNVFITRGGKRAKGDRAVYLDKAQKIILTGSPKATAWEEKNIIEGKEMIFLLDKDRFVVNERVHMKIYPKKNQKGSKSSKRTVKR
jgi:lipopolysaccharide export system protein LptA